MLQNSLRNIIPPLIAFIVISFTQICEDASLYLTIPSGAMNPQIESKCRLIPGIFGLLIQLSLMGLSIGLLILKKRIEVKYSNRTWNEFILDSSKQILGSLWLHVLNLIFAVHLHKKNLEGDSCDWYWINIIVDCTLGTYIEYILFRIIHRVVLPAFVKDPLKAREFESGFYEHQGGRIGSFSSRMYLKQLCVWLSICTSMKLIVILFMQIAADPLIDLSDIFLDRFDDNPGEKLVLVMIVTPFIFNSAQLWVVDNIIKRSERADPEKLVSRLLVS